MDYRVTLDPQLRLSAFDFIISWNGTPSCRAAAMARTSPSTPVRFDLNLVTGATLVLSGVDPAVTADVVRGLIRQALEKRGVREDLEVIDTAPGEILVKLGG